MRKKIDVKKEILEFVDELMDNKTQKGKYISARCLKNFAEDYTSNFDDEEYKKSKDGELVPFVYMSTEVCWLSAEQIKKGVVCKIKNKEFVSLLDSELGKAIKSGCFDTESNNL